jgi:hypothetical protein
MGCAEIEPPSPDRILAPWSGVPPVRLGESKDSVLDKWGEPDEIRQIGTDDIGLIKEEWIYYGRYPEVPVDYKYLSKDKRLIFTGESLTGYETESGKIESPSRITAGDTD